MKELSYKVFGTIVLVVSFMTLSVFSDQTAVDEWFTEDSLSFKILTGDGSSRTVEVRAVAKERVVDNVVIPSSVKKGNVIYSVTAIKNGSFSGCSNLTSITIPGNVTMIEAGAFDGCSMLTNILVSSSNMFYSNKDGVLFNKDQSALIRYPEGKGESEYIIPMNVNKIGDFAFNGCKNLASITISDDVVVIGMGAFFGCNSLSGVYYRGDIPEVDGNIYDSISVDLLSYYPKGNISWKSEIKKRKWQGKVAVEWNPKNQRKTLTVNLNNKVTLDMIWCPKGTFTMGSPASETGHENDETQHEVILTHGFWLGKYEVTQAQYESIMGTNPSAKDRGIGANYPVSMVSYNDALSFCQRLTKKERAEGRLSSEYEYTLPTEAQWEYACRAGTTTALSDGDATTANMDLVGWYGNGNGGEGNAGGVSHPVGLKKPNAWGFYDMHGNVYEWCLDWYGTYPAMAVTDPTGPSTGSKRISRGASWWCTPAECRSAQRYGHDTSNYGEFIEDGFRVALVPVPSKKTIPLAEGVDLDIIRIKPGTFIMGSPKNELGRRDEETQHQVTLTQGYWLGKYEVTQAQYEAIMGTNPSEFKGADLPVDSVSWNNATNFCAKLTASEKAAGRLPEGYEYTLPTEAQWEYACRAGTVTSLNSEKDVTSILLCPEMDEVGWYWYNSDKATHSVGQKLPNAWGLYDMHGNVWEWCLDWYGDYPTSAVTDPMGPSSVSPRVLRGGSWYNRAGSCRSASRSYGYPDSYYGNGGFRVALSLVQ